MAEKLQVTIIGLGLVGASAGLALRRYPDKVSVVGHDKAPDAAGQAKNLGAVDRTEWNLINAVSKADRILLAIPVSEMRATLEAIRQDLREGCVLVDTADVKVPVMAWARELLPAHAHFVGGHPILVTENAGTAYARADVFERRLFCLTPDAETGSTGVHLATDLVEALGAQPFYMDPAEHDGLAGGVEHMPLLVAGALAKLAGDSAPWDEMRKLAGNQFYSTALNVTGNAEASARACLLNRPNAVRWLDGLIAELGEWRGLLEAGDEQALTQSFDRGLVAWQKWMRARETGNWDEANAPDIPTTGTYMRSLFGFGSFREKPAKKGK